MVTHNSTAYAMHITIGDVMNKSRINQTHGSVQTLQTLPIVSTGSKLSAVPTAPNAYLYGSAIEYCGNVQQLDVDIVIPVYNEQEQLADSVHILMNYLRTELPFGWAFTWNIVIADNASTDATWEIAKKLSHAYPQYIRAIHLNQKGRGCALKVAWSQS